MSSTLPSLDRAIELQHEIPRALRGLVAAAKQSGLDPVFIHLIEVRASQINGCAFCLDMHLTLARKAGIDQQKLDVLSVWRETRFFDGRERAALAWCEALTSPQDKHAIAHSRIALTEHFDETEIANLTAVIIAINGWNRIVAGLDSKPARKFN